ncbi:hypothetical protein DSOL_1938 [Desulfosporosinus metallidurans]|uniref:Uncharacterized protein n=1 Tax=Desulfosporosinus metallidurans TaxID=1888891 RepID=A0A1Q8QXP2_9FIRM|nr:hypothetical protein DSOL_1938 [Desulfosporosinus metallidurans]
MNFGHQALNTRLSAPFGVGITIAINELQTECKVQIVNLKRFK